MGEPEAAGGAPETGAVPAYAEDRRSRAARAVPLLLGLAAALAYSDYVADLVLQPSGVDELDIISHLEAPGAPYSALLRTLDVAAGIFSLALVPFLLRALPRGAARWLPALLLATFGVCGALTGLIPAPCPDPASGCGGADGAAQQSLHVTLSLWTDFSILLCPLAVALVTWRRGPRRVVVLGLAAFGVMVLSILVYRLHDRLGLHLALGLEQRAVVSSVSLWLLLVGVISRSATPRALPHQVQRRPARPGP